jgi:uncharacterized protein
VADTTVTSTVDAPAIPARSAISAWMAGWVGGPFLAASLALLAINGGVDDPSIPAIAAATSIGWLVALAVVWWVSTARGTGDLRRDLGISFDVRDLLAVPVGVVAQLALVPAVYVPLRAIWPETFSGSEVEQRARDLVDRAGGFDTLILVAVVVIGAPIVEEVVYRGCSSDRSGGPIGAVASLVLVSLVFALIHFSPVEIPGLFVAGSRVRRRGAAHGSDRAVDPRTCGVQRDRDRGAPRLTA